MAQHHGIDENELQAPTPDATAEQQASELCQACGMCCSGVLFSYVGLTAYEASTLKGSAIKAIVNNGKKAVFGLPCTALSGTNCTMYKKRPGVCRKYMCSLTTGVSKQETELADALVLVTEMKERAGWLLENTPDEVRHRKPLPESMLQQGARFEAMKEVAEQPRGLWLILDKMHEQFAEKEKQKVLSKEDEEYIANAFAFTKQCNEHFEQSTILPKYEELAQKL